MEAPAAGRAALAIATALAAWFFAGGAALAAPSPQPYGKNDAGGFLNILPPGQNGHADAGQVIAFSGLGSVFGSGNVRESHSRSGPAHRVLQGRQLRREVAGRREPL